MNSREAEELNMRGSWVVLVPLAILGMLFFIAVGAAVDFRLIASQPGLIGGLVGGIFGSTEAAAVTVVYALAAGIIFYRKLSWLVIKVNK